MPKPLPAHKRARPGAAITGSLVLAVQFLAGPASAQEACVECSSPAATYKCSVKDAQKLGSSRNLERALEYVCITELAKAGRHESCRVTREFAGPCIGQARLLDLSKQSDQSAVVPEAGSTSVPQPAAQQPAGPQPPRTLEELARETVAKSKQQMTENDQKLKDAAKSAGNEIEKAGTAVGDAVKKTFGCLVTLFTKCF